MRNNISPNAIIGPYRVVSQIGAGGMGEVYLAEDSRLHRKVALKILPAEMAANQDRMRRFKQEATAAAALNHPNIAHIYETGESEGTNFIAMEFVEGVTLREKIHRDKTELRKLLRYLQHTAEGLANAHAAGIVHRDLKPDNIMITREGHAKVLDFGLAKLIEPQLTDTGAGDNLGDAATAIMQQHSTRGLIMGTVGYMSPEQAQGKTNEIDQRSDIFSFGCILFEAATGKKPFEGESMVKSLHSLIYEPTPQIKDLNPAAPADLQRIIRRCLANDKDERYQTIKEVAIELKELRRELESTTGIDTTVSPSQKSRVSPSGGVSSSLQPLPPDGGTPSTHPLSSAEYVVSGITKHKLAAGTAALAILLVLILAAGYGLYKYRASAGVGTGAITSIAVLPFQNKSADADTDYLSDGLAESLIFRLSQLPGLKVSPTSSVMRYKGKETDLAKIAAELGVDAVMTGRLIKRGDNLNITVELVDTKTNRSLWGEQYERKMSDLLATQREIATTIAEKLQLKLAGKDNKGITKRYTDSHEAYQLYLKGRYYFAKRTREGIERSIESYQQAIALDPKFALAYARIADLKNLRRELDIQGELERSVVPNRETANASLENATQIYAADVVAATKSGQAAATRSGTNSSSSLEYAVTQAKSHKLATAIIGFLLVGVISTAGYLVFVSRSGGTKQISSIAVMPFVNESGNADIEYLSEGMTETLINSLSQIPNLSVKARSSVFRYKGRESDLRTVGKELGVQAILNGAWLCGVTNSR